MTRDEFLGDLDWSPTLRANLAAHMDRGDAAAYSAFINPDGLLTARAWQQTPIDWPPGTLATCVIDAPELPELIEIAGNPASRTMRAVELVEQHGWTAYQASMAAGVNQSATSRALARRRYAEANRCSCCGQVVNNRNNNRVAK